VVDVNDLILIVQGGGGGMAGYMLAKQWNRVVRLKRLTCSRAAGEVNHLWKTSNCELIYSGKALLCRNKKLFVVKYAVLKQWNRVVSGKRLVRGGGGVTSTENIESGIEPAVVVKYAGFYILKRLGKRGRRS
jgi:hypothetical protein